MSDLMRYDYDAMMQAADEMEREAKSTEDSINKLMEDSIKLLKEMEGDFANWYENESKLVKVDFEELNQKMIDRRAQLNDIYDRMKGLDRKLGGGN